MKRNQSGFTVVEGLIVAAIVLALAGVGIWIATRQSNDDSAAVSQVDVKAPDAPEVKTADDLQSVEETLKKLKFEDGNTADNAALSSQVDGL